MQLRPNSLYSGCTENYFNVNLDTLFLDFIGHVVGAVLERQLFADIQP